MRVTVTARHCEVTDELRDRAAVVVERLGQMTPFGQEATIVYDVAPLGRAAELRIHLSGGQVLVARGEGEDHRSALDQAEARMRRQLERPAARPGRGRRRTAQT